MSADFRICQVEGCRHEASSLPLTADLPNGLSLALEVCGQHAEELEQEFGELEELVWTSEAVA